MIPAGAFKQSIAHFLAPVAKLMTDPAVGEIMVNGPAEVWAERSGVLVKTDCAFSSRSRLQAALTNIAQYAGRRFDADHPILEAHLPDGSRVEAIMAPLVEQGPVLAIRRFSHSTLTVASLVRGGALSPEAAAYLALCVRKKRNVVVSGGTGSGKTSLLGAISGLIGAEERIVVIEDTREVRLQNPHVVYLETRSADERGRGRIAIRDLLRATLRLRPDRIVVGEVRGGEALDLIQAMTSGHGGSMTTVHAKSPVDALRRLETMAMMLEVSMPTAALRAQTASAVDLIIQTGRTARGTRQVSEISRVSSRLVAGRYRLKPIFRRGPEGGLDRLVERGAER